MAGNISQFPSNLTIPTEASRWAPPCSAQRTELGFPLSRTQPLKSTWQSLQMSLHPSPNMLLRASPPLKDQREELLGEEVATDKWNSQGREECCRYHRKWTWRSYCIHDVSLPISRPGGVERREEYQSFWPQCSLFTQLGTQTRDLEEQLLSLTAGLQKASPRRWISVLFMYLSNKLYILLVYKSLNLEIREDWQSCHVCQSQTKAHSPVTS